MKKIWKKYLAILCMAACVCSLFSISVKAADKKDEITCDEETIEYFDQMLEEYSSQGYPVDMNAEEYIKTIIVEQQFVPQLEAAYLKADRKSLKKDAKKNADTEAYLNETKDVGDYKGSVKDMTFDIDEEEQTAALSGTIEFKKRNVTFTMTMSMADGSFTYSFEKVSAFGEKMLKAALNTLLGMGTVFAVLIFICLLISCFSFVNNLKKEETPAVAAPAAPVQAKTPVQEDVTDDLELVAVISAAIAAAEGTSADGFVVRSIKRVNTSNRRRA